LGWEAKPPEDVVELLTLAAQAERAVNRNTEVNRAGVKAPAF
jgi:hypothetical protein